MVGLELVYGDTKFQFWKMKNSKTPFMLRYVVHKGQDIDIGRDNNLVLRGNHDLDKIDPFWGLENISLVNVNLKQESKLLESLSFDSLTEWPVRKK